jgi:hypothetical protein
VLLRISTWKRSKAVYPNSVKFFSGHEVNTD